MKPHVGPHRTYFGVVCAERCCFACAWHAFRENIRELRRVAKAKRPSEGLNVVLELPHRPRHL